MRNKALKMICKTFCILYLAFCFFSMPAFALDFDLSLDDDVRKNYNPNKIEDDMALPALPKILRENVNEPIKQVNQTATKPAAPAVQKQISKAPAQTAQAKITKQKQTISATENRQTISSGNYAIIKQGTRMRVKLQTGISDRSRRGSRLSFILQYPVSTTYLTLPKGTVLTGRIADSHRPQLAGNGGLIVLKFDSLTLDDGNHNISAIVTQANYKRIFFNNIKGKRKYFVSMVRSTSPGRHFFRKMAAISGNLARDGSSILLTPFSLGYGIIGLGGNIMVAPVLALFHKGDYVHLKEGSDLEIKLTQDLIIYN